VRDMLSALAGTMAGCKEVLKAQHVGNALYGLQGMSSEHVEVRDMLSALAGHVAGCKGAGCTGSRQCAIWAAGHEQRACGGA
jgi:hypothetical protein